MLTSNATDRHDGLAQFHPAVAHWFRTRIGTPSAPQREAWPEIAAGRSVLVTAPTGAGKTLAAFLVALDRLLKQGLAGELPDGIQVLYVSPLKALNNDINRNLDQPLAEIRAICEADGIPFPDIRKAVRTGDTSSSERQSMLRKPPHILITTPESLYLLLTSPKASALLAGVNTLIVDEIHAVLGSKRGTHLSLSVERLAAATPPGLVRIGLSATVRPFEAASRFLGGYDAQGQPNPVTLVAPPLKKLKDLRLEMPVSDFRSLEAGSVWPEIYDTVARLVRAHTATIVFVNNRATAERIAANVNDLTGETLCVPHHGSLSKERRHQIEASFKNGTLRCMVATATLELGIDVGQVDLMIQISAPLTIAGGLQRLGRAGHRLDAVSRGRLIPKTRGDLLKTLYIAREMTGGRIEATHLPREPLDVLAQHLVSMSCTARWSESDLLGLIRRAASYRELRHSDLRRVLAMLSGDYEHREDIPTKPRLMWDRVNGTVEGTPYSRMLAISAGGTIPDRGMFPVMLAESGTRIGELDEEYVFEARPGDVFMLGNVPWQMERIDRDRVVVSPAASTHGAETPFWRGDGLGMPLEQGLRYGQFVRHLETRLLNGTLPSDLAAEGLIDEGGAENLIQYLVDQREATVVLPTDRLIVMETVADGTAGVTVILHALFGGRVNATLETLLRHALEEMLHLSVYTTHTDELILLYLYGVPDEVPPFFSLLSAEDVERTLLRILPSSSRFSITFRYNAYRSLMMGTRKHGTRLPLWIQRLRSVETLEQAIRSTDHPLLVETMRECMEEAFDLRGTAQVLEDLRNGRITVQPVQSWYPSPFAAEVMMRFEGELLYAPAAPHPGGIRKPVVSGMDALHLEEAGSLPVPEAEAVRRVTEENNPLPRFLSANSVNEVHSLLLVYGDLPWSMNADGPVLPATSGHVETQAGNVTHADDTIQADDANDLENRKRLLSERLRELQSQCRVRMTAMPVSRWIAREEDTLYMAAEPSVWGPDAATLNAVPTAFASTLAPIPGTDGLWTQEEAATRIVRRYARYVGPFREADVHKRYLFEPALLQRVLATLEQDRFLVQAQFGDDTEAPFWCHRVLWERMRRQDIRAQAASVQSAPASVYAAWLPGHQQVLPVYPERGRAAPATVSSDASAVAQAVHGGANRRPSRIKAGISSERLLSAITQFSGVPFPAAWWEEMVFPARVPGYHTGLLDRLCATGRVFWRVHPAGGDKALLLAFYDAEKVAAEARTGSGEAHEVPAEIQASGKGTVPPSLTVEAESILATLSARGACFTHQLTGATGLPVTMLMQALNLLVSLGFVANDSFAPIRLFLEWNKARDPSRFTKRLAMMTARMEMGRWERVAPVTPAEPKLSLDGWFLRWGMACKEVSDAEDSPAWGEAYTLLKTMEFTGKTRRGLFFASLSGIQFLREGIQPAGPASPAWHVLVAADPALAYGKILPHDACELDFSRVPGTAVVLRDGVPVLVVDRSGVGFRTLLEGAALEEALWCLVEAFGEKRIWPSDRTLAIRTDAAAPGMSPEPVVLKELLAGVGFESEPTRMVLRR